MYAIRSYYDGLGPGVKRSDQELFRKQLALLGLGLENRLKDKVGLLSGGQRQALTLLMATLIKPQILLLDEHTAALDPRNAEIVMRLTRSFAERYGLTVMMITHNMAHAIEYGNRLLMMDSGEIALEIGANEKSKLGIDDVVKRFRDVRNKQLTSDQMLLHV